MLVHCHRVWLALSLASCHFFCFASHSTSASATPQVRLQEVSGTRHSQRRHHLSDPASPGSFVRCSLSLPWSSSLVVVSGRRHCPCALHLSSKRRSYFLVPTAEPATRVWAVQPTASIHAQSRIQQRTYKHRYSSLADVEPTAGIYSGIFPALVYALWGVSRQVRTSVLTSACTDTCKSCR